MLWKDTHSSIHHNLSAKLLRRLAQAPSRWEIHREVSVASLSCVEASSLRRIRVYQRRIRVYQRRIRVYQRRILAFLAGSESIGAGSGTIAAVSESIGAAFESNVDAPEF